MQCPIFAVGVDVQTVYSVDIARNAPAEGLEDGSAASTATPYIESPAKRRKSDQHANPVLDPVAILP